MPPEQTLIPDTLYGAILLSIIDFFLSFVVITFIGFVLAMFPHLNRIGKALQATPVAVAVMPEEDEGARHAAVIAAAIHAMLGVRRIARIGEPRPATGWTRQARTRLHTSHAPRTQR